MTNRTPLGCHHGFASQPIRERAGEQRRKHGAQQHGGDDERKLSCIQPGGGFEIRQRAGDDANVHAVKQSAQSGDQQEKTVVSRLCRVKIPVHVLIASAVLILAVAGAPSQTVAWIFGCADLFSATERIWPGWLCGGAPPSGSNSPPAPGGRRRRKTGDVGS